MIAVLLTVLGCHAAPPDLVLRGGTVVGLGPADVYLRAGRIAEVGEVTVRADVVDVTGRWLAPAFIDSHVHLTYLPQADAMAAGGVAAAVDWAAPERTLSEHDGAVRLVRSGPMITAPGGYPTRDWGADGYGLEVADSDAGAAAVRRLKQAGAGVIKVPVTGPPVLDDHTLAAIVQTAHAEGLLVGAHALRDAEAARAAAAGVDVLVHVPTQRLSEATVAAWAGRTVISTLAAFGGGADAVSNLRDLHEAGATVLYGTDFGNSRTAGVDPNELYLLRDAGLDGEAILAAGTSAAAGTWGLPDLGAIAVGHDASLLVLDADPRVDPTVLARPHAVYIRGERL